MRLMAILYWQYLAGGGTQLSTTGTYVLRWGTTYRQSSANTNKSLIGSHLSKKHHREDKSYGSAANSTLPLYFKL
jgi:hypothetical protein